MQTSAIQLELYNSLLWPRSIIKLKEGRSNHTFEEAFDDLLVRPLPGFHGATAAAALEVTFFVSIAMHQHAVASGRNLERALDQPVQIYDAMRTKSVGLVVPEHIIHDAVVHACRTLMQRTKSPKSSTS